MAGTNLLSVGTAELGKMPIREFVKGLEGMNPEAIVRLRRERKLTAEHEHALEIFLRDHPSKRLKKPEKESRLSARGQARMQRIRNRQEAAQREKSAKAANDAQASEAPRKREGYVELFIRLKAWWEGVDVEIVRREFDERWAAKNPPKNNPDLSIEIDNIHPRFANDRWTDARLDVTQILWGEGFSLPGGRDFALKLVKSLALRPEHTFADLSSGLGGGTRAIAKRYQLWLEGYEREEDLSDYANDISIEQELDAQAPVTHYAVEKLALQENRYDAIMIREMLFSVDDKKALLQDIGRALKSDGNLLFTDFVLTDRLQETETLAAWRAAEPFRARPWTMDEYRQMLSDLRYVVRVFEDVTDDYVAYINAGWMEALKAVKAGKLSREMVDALMEEGQMWLARSRALQEGRLRLLRCHAVIRHKVDRAMSDALRIDD
ncbi:methyltransferase domain-containing protein [Tepidicaulis sp.]|jgi:ubiquinone/menaquinone biosynthesis C-methylase UbiE|uniref:methyltransferase domain-containing protein n=1 Tax=Tepidicaulis sp. TaxID=1920809 RepID=UPI003B5BCBC8